MSKSMETIVVDPGTQNFKAGNGGEEAPRFLSQNLIGFSKTPYLELLTDKRTFYLSEQLEKNKGKLRLEKIIKKRKICDFDSYEKMLHHLLYDKLQQDSQSKGILLTENFEDQKSKIAEIVFENMGSPFMYIGNQSCLGLFSTGQTKGIVVDSGHGMTHIVPVYEGYVSKYSVQGNSFCGKQLNKELLRLFQMKGYSLGKQDLKVVQEIKQGFCYLSQDYEQELKDYRENANTKETIYDLPDGQRIRLGQELIEATERFFQENSQEIDLADSIYKTYSFLDSDIRDHLFQQIFYIGGNSLLKGLPERVSKLLDQYSGNTLKFTQFLPQERKFSSWIGGSLLSCLNTFNQMGVT